MTLKTAVSSTDPLFMHKEITCTTSCAYPAPMISWFENGQPFNAEARVLEYDCSSPAEKKGQKVTSSTIAVKDTYENKERNDNVISCVAENVIGEPKITKAMAINYDDTPTSPESTEREDTQQTWLVISITSILIVVTLAIAVNVFYTKVQVDKFNVNQRVKNSKRFNFENDPETATFNHQEVIRLKKRVDRLVDEYESMIKCDSLLKSVDKLRSSNDPETAINDSQEGDEHVEEEMEMLEDGILEQVDMIRERLRGKIQDERKHSRIDKAQQELVKKHDKDIEKLKMQLERAEKQSAEKNEAKNKAGMESQKAVEDSENRDLGPGQI